MDLRQLRYFTVLAETRNFHRAAERLHMSQPPLTVAIRKLEEELGTKLFHRDARGVRLTEAGQAVLSPARATLAHAAQVTEAARLASEGMRGRLTIWFVGSAISGLLPRLISPFRASFPEVDLALEERNSVEIVRAISARQIDIGIVRLPVMESAPVAIDVIERDELIVALPARDHPNLQDVVSLADLSGEPFITYTPQSVLHATIRLACQKAGFVPRIVQEVNQVSTILSLVLSGLGIALLPARTARFAPEGVKLATLKDPIPIEMGIARALDAGPLVRNFVSSAMEVSDSHSISDMA
jgi:DNA-binding transcriptional LysR family regulator